MIPLWIISLLGTTCAGEFSYTDKYRISIEGKFLDGEWVDAQPNPRLASEIEKIILQQASILYRRAVAAGEE